MNHRRDFFIELASRIVALEGRLIVAIDGVDGSGKTTFADELAPVLTQKGRPVVQASVDGFHNTKAIRYRLGRNDPEGFFLDSHNYQSLHRFLLGPFRAGANTVDTARYDHAADHEIS
ncbi:uridine kinase (plasmid) [Rhizobium rhizogenes K84]|uniref:Uridine kinase n=1 Tax=Rhizobium rhizogenes (strain K84 / ATCC BAA-868) TaxID=311403 RepID=B9JQ70_RHIR8|nr:uridine kinase [Rhizobium rhizogenes K84]